MNEFLELLKHGRLKALFMTETDNSFIQFFRYLFVGGFASVVDWGALWLFYGKFSIWKYLSVALAFLFGLLSNYTLSKLFVFTGVTKNHSASSEFMVYLTTGLVGLGWTELFMLLFDEALGIHYMIAKIITTAIVFLWNFGSKKILLYRKRDDK